jgi:hypothetical protein
MQELSLVIGHWFVSQPSLAGALGEYTEFALLGLSPGQVLLEEPKSGIRIRDVVVCMRRGINVKSCSKTLVSLQAETFIVTFELRPRWRGIRAASKALNFLVTVAAGTSDDGLGRTRR